MGRYGRDSYDARYGMDRYGSGGLEQHHDPTDDDAEDDDVSFRLCHHMRLRLLFDMIHCFSGSVKLILSNSDACQTHVQI